MQKRAAHRSEKVTRRSLHPRICLRTCKILEYVPAFKSRSAPFEDAVASHSEGRYSLSISGRIPQIEGVVTDWNYANITPGVDVPFRQVSKTITFRDILATKAKRKHVDERVAESVIDFILDGPVLEIFTDWLSPVADNFPNRNVVGHGKYLPAMHSEENSIKVILMLDTIYQIMAAHDTD